MYEDTPFTIVGIIFLIAIGSIMSQIFPPIVSILYFCAIIGLPGSIILHHRLSEQRKLRKLPSYLAEQLKRQRKLVKQIERDLPREGRPKEKQALEALLHQAKDQLAVLDNRVKEFLEFDSRTQRDLRREAYMTELREISGGIDARRELEAPLSPEEVRQEVRG